MREQTAREYLKTIFVLEMEGVVRGAYIAREMNVTKASVSVALKSLVEEGYLIMEADHSVRMTEKGKHMARESIHQTVKNGRNYHELVQHIQAQEEDLALDEQTLRERALRWLAKERACGLMEAHHILSRRYYCVRIVDLAHFLGLSSATVRTRLKRLEHNGFLRVGEDTVVTLTHRGEKAATDLFDAHAAEREAFKADGATADEAEQRAACLYGELTHL